MNKRAKRLLISLAATVLVVPVMLMGFLLFLGGGRAIASACGPTDPMAPGVQLSGGQQLTGEQVGNARIIIGVGQGLGASGRDIKLAVWVAYHESSLRNLTYGTADSLGLFQQRPSQGWGTPQEILNPIQSSTNFYKHLFDVPNRNSLSFLDEALAVQHANRQAYLSPNHNFLSWEPIVDELLAGSGIDTKDTGSSPQSGDTNIETICSSTTDIGVPGKVIMAPGANLPGQPVQQETLDFLARVAGIYGKTLICTTGTNHSYLTVDGLVSDHATGHACDFGMVANGGTDNGTVGDAIARACLIAAGDLPLDATEEAAVGGLYTKLHDGLRIQCIWKTDEGGNHHNHVHIGARPG
jgi:hypothetical protein